MTEISVAQIDRKSSIETEPRTLNHTQFDIAREAALHVVHTRTKEEACHIFTEGLEPVETMYMPSKWEGCSDGDGDESSCTSRESRQRNIKDDVHTAPF